MTTYTIRKRVLLAYNNDPQRRCYNGCHASIAREWSAWVAFDSGIPAEKVERKLAFWRELNDYAVSQRGEDNTKCEYEAVEEKAND